MLGVVAKAVGVGLFRPGGGGDGDSGGIVVVVVLVVVAAAAVAAVMVSLARALRRALPRALARALSFLPVKVAYAIGRRLIAPVAQVVLHGDLGGAMRLRAHDILTTFNRELRGGSRGGHGSVV